MTPFKAYDQGFEEKISYLVSPLDYRQDWTCPHCFEKLSFVNTTTRTKHFRHQVECPYQTEPETKEHLNLKKYIYENLKPDYDARYEVNIGNRITDVLIKSNNHQIGIECQVTPMSITELHRLEDYFCNNAYIVWILYPKYFIPKTLNNLKEWLNPSPGIYYRLRNFEINLMNLGIVFYYDYDWEILRRLSFVPKISESDEWGEYECSTTFSISDFEVFTPIEMINYMSSKFTMQNNPEWWIYYRQYALEETL